MSHSPKNALTLFVAQSDKSFPILTSLSQKRRSSSEKAELSNIQILFEV